MANANAPWEVDDTQFNTGSTGGQEPPSVSTPSSTADVNVPWGENAAHETQTGLEGEKGSVWDTVKADWGATVDSLAAGMLSNESSDRSRYAMKRAQRTSAAAAAQQEKLTGVQAIEAMAAGRVAPGLAAGVVNPALGAAVFGAQSTGDVLRGQAETSGRYDLQKAVTAGATMAGVDAATGGMFGTGGKFLTQVAKKAGEGAVSGEAQNTILNLASGKPWYENSGTALAGGALAGGAMHVAAPAVKAIVRAPQTLRDIQEAGERRYGSTRPFERPSEAAPEPQPQVNPDGSVDADFGNGDVRPALPAPDQAAQQTTQQATAEAGAIPTGDRIPGTEGWDPTEQYGPYKNSRFQPGMGFGEGARTQGESPMPSSNPKGPLESAKGLAQNLRDTLNVARNPKGAARATESELASAKVGMDTSPAMKTAQQEVEQSSNILSDAIGNLGADDARLPQYAQAKVNLEAQHGTAAALGRRDQLAAKVGFNPMTTWNDRSVGEGWLHTGDKYHVGEQFGVTRQEMDADKIHLRDADENQVFKSQNPQMRDELLTRASYLNDAHNKYNQARTVVRDVNDSNIGNVTRIKNELSNTANGSQMHLTAVRLERNLKTYRDLADSLNKRPIDPHNLHSLSTDIETDMGKLGIGQEMKSFTGEKGAFSPFLDMQGWNEFHHSMKAIDENIPTHTAKEAKKETGLGLAHGAVAAGIGVANPVAGMVTYAGQKLGPEGVRAYDRAGLRRSQVKGRVMAQELANRPAPRTGTQEEIDAALKRGGFDEAAVHAEQDLRDQGINPGDVPPEASAPVTPEPAPTAPTGGGEAAEAPISVPEAANNVVPSVMHRHQLQAINHPRAYDDNLSAGEADAILAQHAANQNAAGMATRPTNEAPAPEPTPEPAAPTQEEQDFWNAANEHGRRRRAERAAAEAKKPSERTPEEQALVDETPEPVERPDLARRPQPKAQEEAPEVEPTPTVEETPEPVTEAPVAPEEAPKPKAEPEKLAQKPKPKAEPEKEVEPTPEIAEGEGEIDTNLKQGETQAERTARVASMVVKQVQKKADTVLEKPTREVGLKVRSRAEQVKQHIPVAAKVIKNIADKHQINEADIWESLMKRKGGIESIFDRGFSNKAMSGEIMDHITAVRKEASRVAQGHVDEAGEIVRRSLIDHNVPPNREEAHTTLRKELKEVGGLTDAQADEAFARAKKATPFFTPAQVRRHAAQVLRGEAEKVRGKQPLADTKTVTVSTHDALHAAADKFDVRDQALKSDIHSIISKATNGGKDELGAAEQKAVIKQMQKAINDHAKVYRDAAKKAKKPAEKARLNNKADQIEEANARQGAADTELSRIKDSNEKAAKAGAERDAKQKAQNDAEAAKLETAADKVEAQGKAYDENLAKAQKEARQKLEAEMDGMTGQELEMAGGIVGDRIPDVDSINDPEFAGWKTQMETAISGLRKKGRPRPAHVLETVLNLMETGLKRKEELPGDKYKELIWSEKEYQRINQALGVNEEGELDIDKNLSNHYGNLGRKMRSLMLGSAKQSVREKYIHLPQRELEAKRAAAKDIGEAGIDTAGVVEKKRGALDNE